MKAPFPYFGGKSTVADIIWSALGQPRHYIEPFFGSGAVLLSRPEYKAGMFTETVNDKDGFLCNVWRSLQADPDEVAKWCDWPVNHADLSARKKKLIQNEPRLLENLIANDEFFDAKLAGYWIWAASCWIGSRLTLIGQRPHLNDGGKGVHAIGQRQHLGNGGGIKEPYNKNIYSWFRELSERLRYVRVVCGDWTRVCGGNWQNKIAPVGIFFDPPYGITDRDTSLYHHDSIEVAHQVREWCLERGESDDYRIVLAGYEEHGELLNHGWRTFDWQTKGGYSHLGGTSNNNAGRERIYFSPHCKDFEPQLSIFGIIENETSRLFEKTLAAE